MNIRLDNHTLEMLVFGDPKLDEMRRLLKEHGLLDWTDSIEGDMHFSWNDVHFGDGRADIAPSNPPRMAPKKDLYEEETDPERKKLLRLVPERSLKNKKFARNKNYKKR